MARRSKEEKLAMLDQACGHIAAARSIIGSLAIYLEQDASARSSEADAVYAALGDIADDPRAEHASGLVVDLYEQLSVADK